MNLLLRCRRFSSLALLVALAGCGGSGGGSSPTTTTNGLQVYVDKKYSEMAIPVDGTAYNLTLTVPSLGKVSGALTPVAKPNMIAKLEAGLTYTYEGDMSLVSGGVSFTGTFGNLAATIQGTLPNAPSTVGGSFTITYGGKTYGPFVLGGTYTGGTTTGTTYTITVIPKVSGFTDMTPSYINSSGEVVGYVGPLSAAHAFKWTASGGTVDITTEAGFPKGSGSSTAIQVNDAGQVCGTSVVSANLATTNTGFLESGGSVSTFTSGTNFPGGPSVAGIFSDGTVIADESMMASGGSNVTQTIAFKNGTTTPIGNSNDVFALGVNPIANFTTGPVSYAGATQQWFTYTEGGTIVKVPAAPYANLSVRDIASSLVTGPHDEIVVDRIDNGHLAIYGGPYADADTGISGAPTGINASGVVTLNSTTPELWSKAGGVVALQTRIPASLNLTLDAVYGINNVGQVICHGVQGTGSAQQTVAVLITPLQSASLVAKTLPKK